MFSAHLIYFNWQVEVRTPPVVNKSPYLQYNIEYNSYVNTMNSLSLLLIDTISLRRLANKDSSYLSLCFQ